MNKHLIMGTAGHVDHGKTALIKALTGYDCDTHKQEKERGITINLGFSHLDLPDGNSIGIVDVPGHMDFIKTMVAGASGIDFVLLVIAADEGIMPQTEEHLQIMETLDIKYGLIALTKIDLVDAELLELCRAEIGDFTKATFLENSPVIQVSSVKNNGISQLISQIADLCDRIEPKDSKGIFRMYIDRFFTKKGFGTIVNGSVISGSISSEDKLFLLPANRELRIRKMEHHGKETTRIYAGDRASLNIAGVKQKELKAGMVLADRFIEATELLDVKVTLYKDIQLAAWSNIIFLLGANRMFSKMHLLNEEKLEAGKSCLAQIYLPQKIITQFGDKFIIRNSSGDQTLGGGIIIDPHPLHHRRKRKEQIKIVEEIASGDLDRIVWAEVKKVNRAISAQELAGMINMKSESLESIIRDKQIENVDHYETKAGIVLLTNELKNKYYQKILTLLAEYHKTNPLLEKGLTAKELKSIFPKEKDDIAELVLQKLIKEMVEKKQLTKIGNTWKLMDHKIHINKDLKEHLANLKDYFASNRSSTFNLQNLVKEFPAIKETKLKQMLAYLEEQKVLCSLQGRYLLVSFLEEAKQKLHDYLTQNPEGIRLSEFRDILGTNRATAIVIMEHFDSLGLTLRKDNYRVLNKKSR